MHKTLFKLLSAVGFAAAACLSANAALAGDNCGKSAREAPPACVDWWWEGEYDKGYKRVYAKNNCQGEMVLKIDIAGGGKDKIWELGYNEANRQTYGKVVRDVKCCSNLGDGCDQARLTPSSCENNYNESVAALNCQAETFSQSGLRCDVTAECVTGQTIDTTSCDASGKQCIVIKLTERIDTSIHDVKIVDIHRLQTCGGELTLGGC